jgi:hypothetical protein
MSGSDESKRLTFYKAIENGARKISENHNPVYGGYTEINYTLTVKNSCGEHSKWLQQHFGHFVFKIRYKFSDKFLVYMMVGQFGLEFICP